MLARLLGEGDRRPEEFRLRCAGNGGYESSLQGTKCTSGLIDSVAKDDHAGSSGIHDQTEVMSLEIGFDHEKRVLSFEMN